jgi:hypothetical protein
MKKLSILLLVILTATSCSLFDKSSMTQEEADALVAQKAAVDEELANLQQQYDLLKLKSDECASALEQYTLREEMKAAATAGKYCVITGAFKNSGYADDYGEEMRQKGGTGDIVQGPYNFNLVVFSAHSTLNEAIQEMYKARKDVVFDAWVYTKR